MAGAPLTSSPVSPPASDSPSVATTTTTTSHSTKLSTHSAPLTLRTPAQITALALVPHELGYEADMLVAGSEGTLRLYDLARGRVLRAVRGLGGEVGSVIVVGSIAGGKATASKENLKGGAENEGKDASRREEEVRLWVACGRKALHFALPLNPGAPPLLNASDATALVDVCEEDEDDAVNQLALHSRGTHLAFCTDAGAVGVVEVDSVGSFSPNANVKAPKIRRMRGRHSNLASTLHFVPHRPRELVSGGYDCALLLHDWEMGSVLGRGEVNAPTPSTNGISSSSTNGISLSPPFVICSAMSTTGALVAGLADGRVWVGVGGEKEPPSASKKKTDKKSTKKWEGLDERGVLSERVAEGPVVGVAWKTQNTFLACSLLGQLSEVTLERGDVASKGDERGDTTSKNSPSTGPRLRHRVLRQIEGVSKVNALAVSGGGESTTGSEGALAVSGGGVSAAGGAYVVVGGVGKDGKGVIEVAREVG